MNLRVASDSDLQMLLEVASFRRADSLEPAQHAMLDLLEVIEAVDGPVRDVTLFMEELKIQYHKWRWNQLLTQDHRLGDGKQTTSI